MTCTRTEIETLSDFAEKLAGQMDHWHHLIFNASHHPNRVGLTNTAAEIQQAVCDLRVMLGMDELDAKLLAGLPLSEQDRAEYDERKRKESIEKHQEGLHAMAVPTVRFQPGRKADREA